MITSKIIILELILNDLAKLTFQSLIMSTQGEIVATSAQPPEEKEQRLTQKLIEVSDFTALIGRSTEDITCNLGDRRLYFRKVCSNGKSAPMEA